MFYDAKCVRGKIKLRLRHPPLIIPFSWQIKRKKRGKKRMLFNFVYSWKPETLC
jgi:hypothetical protein